MKILGNALKLAVIPALALTCAPAMAQDAEETINVGLNVQIDIPDAVISGLEDVTLNWTTIPEGNNFVQASQPFCLFSPTPRFDLTLTGTHQVASTFFHLRDAAQTDPDLDTITYAIQLEEIFNASTTFTDAPSNGVPITVFNGGDFVTDATCTDGDNMQLTIIVLGESTVINPNAPNNNDVLRDIADGELHSYTDQLTFILEPQI